MVLYVASYIVTVGGSEAYIIQVLLESSWHVYSNFIFKQVSSTGECYIYTVSSKHHLIKSILTFKHLNTGLPGWLKAAYNDYHK